MVARGLHATCVKNDILEELQERGFMILDATNIVKKEKQENNQGEQETSKCGLPLFILSFDNTENMDKIYSIKTILNTVIKLEPLRKNTKLVPQCKRCQGFNDTQTYCQRTSLC